MAARAQAIKSTDFFGPAMEKVLGANPPDEKQLDTLLGLAESKEIGISGYWRKNISHLESSELANALGSLAKMAGYLSKNVGRTDYNLEGQIIEGMRFS